MKAFSILFTVVFCMAASCNSAKNSTDDKAQQQNLEQAMIDQGFIAGTVLMQPAQEACPVVIKIDEELLDPIELNESFKIHGQQVWVKFSRLRMPPRCDVASPIAINEIQKKADQ